MKKLLLVGASPDVLEAKRVILEGAGYQVRVLAAGGRVREVAEEWEASLIIMDATARGKGLRGALEDLSSAETPSSVPVLVIGDAGELGDFEGPCRTLPRPARKRKLLESARMLIRSREDAPRSWSKKRPT
jgi:DNA-binding response OmpR family regulator